MLDDRRGIVWDFGGILKESGEERRTVKNSVPDYLRSQHVMNNTTKHWLSEFLRCWFIKRSNTVKLRVYSNRFCSAVQKD